MVKQIKISFRRAILRLSRRWSDATFLALKMFPRSKILKKLHAASFRMSRAAMDQLIDEMVGRRNHD